MYYWLSKFVTFNSFPVASLPQGLIGGAAAPFNSFPVASTASILLTIPRFTALSILSQLPLLTGLAVMYLGFTFRNLSILSQLPHVGRLVAVEGVVTPFNSFPVASR